MNTNEYIVYSYVSDETNAYHGEIEKIIRDIGMDVRIVEIYMFCENFEKEAKFYKLTPVALRIIPLDSPDDKQIEKILKWEFRLSIEGGEKKYSSDIRMNKIHVYKRTGIFTRLSEEKKEEILKKEVARAIHEDYATDIIGRLKIG